MRDLKFERKLFESFYADTYLIEATLSIQKSIQDLRYLGPELFSQY